MPKAKVKENQKIKGGRSNTATAGAQEVTRLYTAWKRLLNPERNLSTAHAPRLGKEVFFWVGICMPVVEEEINVTENTTI